MRVELRTVAAMIVLLLASAWPAAAQTTFATITGAVTDAVAGREGMQLITDQGTPYLAEAAKQAYDAIGVEHAPQREGTPTEKATVERGFGIVKNALAPVFDLLNRIATAVPALQQPVLARHVATLLVALVIDIKSAIALLAPVTLVLVLISALRGAALRDVLREFWFLPVAIAVGALPPGAGVRDAALPQPRSPRSRP